MSKFLIVININYLIKQLHMYGHSLQVLQADYNEITNGRKL